MRVKTEYSIISKGTEKYLKKGYISISYSKDGFRYIQDIDHGKIYSEPNNHSLKLRDNYSIENIALSRFEMIPELLLTRIHFKDNILICGMGCVGYATINNLIDKGYKTITVLKNKYDIFVDNFKIKINIVTGITSNYNTYIDTTGNSDILKKIFMNINNMGCVIILGTPRDEDYQISPLVINRKNLSIYGGHEINGYNQIVRNEVFMNLLEKNKTKNLKNICDINIYSKEKLNSLKEKSNKIYEILKY